MAFINDMIQVDPQSGQIACPKCGKAGATVHCLSCNTAVTTVKVDKTKGAVLCGKCGHSLHGQEQGR
jgi:DNA-directed RNA polymerase subunit RPC12/RpoP